MTDDAARETGSAIRRIYLVDDHPAIQTSFTRFIGRQPDMEVCGVARRGLDALRTIPEAAPDLVIVDVSLPDVDGIDLVGKLKSAWPDLPVLVVSGRDAGSTAERALRMGAAAYIDKLEAGSMLIPTIRRTLGMT